MRQHIGTVFTDNHLWLWFHSASARRWWSVILCAIWLIDHIKVLKRLAQYIHEYYPSSSTGLRHKWRDIGTLLHHPLMVAHLHILAAFGRKHYLEEMAWSEEGDGVTMAGYKSCTLPQRLVHRLSALRRCEGLLRGARGARADHVR